MSTKLPMQPVYKDERDIIRFTPNLIVCFLLDAGPFDMNTLAAANFSAEDHEQFAQLIGYSLSGFDELSYTSDETSQKAWGMASELT